MRTCKSYFKKISENLKKEGRGGFCNRFLLALFFVGIYVGLFSGFINDWWLAGILFLFICFSGALKIKPLSVVTLLSVMLLLFQVMEEKRNFEFNRRPYINVLPTEFSLVPPGAPQEVKGAFLLHLNLKNSGNVGAIMEDFEYVPFVTKDDKFNDAPSDEPKGINLKRLNQNFGVIEWKNAPVFPDATIPQEISNSPFGKSDFDRLGGDDINVFFWFKVKYRAIGSKDIFYFWTIVKSKGNNKFQYVKSGEDNRNFPKEYGIE